MHAVFETINKIFSFVGPLSDFLWDFPTNFEWYANIPLLGNFSFAIILLLGSGIYFSFRLGFMQVTHFKKSIKIMTQKRSVETGISPLAAFGILCNIAGLELGNLWAFSDLGNILIVFFNVPIVYVGARCVFKATKHYKANDGTPFTSAVVDRDDCQYWDNRATGK